MADPTQADLQLELDEINAQLAEMVGAADFSVAGFSISEGSLQDNLTKRKASLEWRIKCLANGGSASDTVTGVQFSGGAY